jgi:SSS family solute:Na+ symporter
LLIGELPDGFLGTLQSLKEIGKTDPFEYSLDPSKVGTIWTGIVAMSIYHVVVYGVNQMMVQRTLTAKSLGDAKKAYIFMGYIAFFVFVLFFGLGILFYSYYGGRSFDNENLIVLEFVSSIGFPGLLGIVTAAIVAAAMSSLDSSLNSMATVTTIDFYQKFFKKNESPEHYLKASRWFTLFWAVFTVVPAMMFISSAGSVIEILSKVGSFFVGAKLAMFGLGFFSKHTTERGLIIGVIAGFVSLWYVEFYMDIAWPWYCALGGLVSIVVAWVASVVIDGFQKEFNQFTVKGQLRHYEEQGLPVMKDGWYVVSGKVDKASYVLLVFFVLCIAGLWIVQAAI